MSLIPLKVPEVDKWLIQTNLSSKQQVWLLAQYQLQSILQRNSNLKSNLHLLRIHGFISLYRRVGGVQWLNAFLKAADRNGRKNKILHRPNKISWLIFTQNIILAWTRKRRKNKNKKKRKKKQTMCTCYHIADGWRRFAFLRYNCAGRVTQICVFRYNCAGRVTQICVFNTVKVGTSASSP